MKIPKHLSALLMACLMTAHAFAADGPARPLRVLYLGPVEAGSSGRGSPEGGNPRTDYVYLPGQTLAPEAIYFDHLQDASHLTAAYLKHVDAVVQVMPDAGLEGDRRKLLEEFEKAGKGLIKYPDAKHPADAELRQAVLEKVPGDVKSAWERFVAARPPLQRLPGEVPNYERRPEPIGYQAPLKPEDSIAYTQVPADFELQLFAAEPDVIKPIYIAWDERGRAWVVEARDYPHGLVPDSEPGQAEIKICEDTNGDGRADKFTVFADGLNLPTALVFVDGGIIVAEARRMLFLKDTTGDGKADVREPLLPGWGIFDTHAMQSNLARGFDNWLYGAVGYSNFQGNVGGKDLRFGQGIFRFKADGSALEFLHQFNNNTWGFGQNAYGDTFGSTANGNPSFYGYLPAHLIDATQPNGGSRRLGFRDPDAPEINAPQPTLRRLSSARSLAGNMRMHPNTPNVRMVDNFGGYTAAAGHAFMVSDALPERLQGKALVTEPTAKLIGMMDIQPDGGGYKAADGLNLLASTDEWMSPIFADVGPDGAVWVIDFYNFVIQHNPTPNVRSAGMEARTGQGGAYETDLRDMVHGRIYRAVWKDAPETKIQSLADAGPAELVQALDSGNQFWALTAQRLIVDNKVTDAAPALKARVASGSGGKGAIHALWALEGIGGLDAETHHRALLSDDPAVRRNAVRALPANEEGLELFFKSNVARDADLITRQAALVKVAEFPTTPEIQTLVSQLSSDSLHAEDGYLNDTVTLLGRVHEVSGVGANEVKVEAGDPERGADLFFNNPAAACATCHAVDGKGGAIGPALDGLAARHDPDYILQSLVDPNAVLAEGFEQLGVSPMPPVGLILKEQEVADVMAYLQTLTVAPEGGVAASAEESSPVAMPAGAEQEIHSPDEAGYIRHWVMLAPIALPRRGTVADLTVEEQIKNEAALQPRAGDKVAIRNREFTWRNVTATANHFDLSEILNGTFEHAAAYMVTYIEADEEMKDLTLALGSNDQARLYLNGKDIYAYQDARPLELDADKGTVTLRKGVNVIVFKVLNETNNWQGSMRFLDREGAPVRSLKIKLAP